jgi:hopanoid biosynthesis associated RND transporter like protein HpnN
MFLSAIVARCVRHAVSVVVAFAVLAALAITLAATHLSVTTDIGPLFSAKLPWKQQEAALARDFPQFTNLIVAVVDADIPEEAEATAQALAEKLGSDHTHFSSVRRPDASPYLAQEGLLFLPTPVLTDLLDKTVDAEPFLGQLAADPTARGLFGALGLIGQGVVRGQAQLQNFDAALSGFHAALASAVAGHAKPLSWERLLAGPVAALAGPDKIVLIQPRLDFHLVEPGGSATADIHAIAASLPFVAAGAARVHLTGSVPLSDEEFASAAHGAVAGLAISFLLVVLWLFLALGSFRLILPVVMTLLLGLILTTGFAAAAVGTLNLISVAFAILFVGIAVDFSIQFAVRLRDVRLHEADMRTALQTTGRRVGIQILVASAATAAGFLAFVPTSFRGVAELGLIAGGGMLIAFVCTITFLPATLSLFKPSAETTDVGFTSAAPLDRFFAFARVPLLIGFSVLFVSGMALTPRLTFDSNTLHTKRPDSEALLTLMRLLHNPVTNPFTSDIVRPSIADAHALAVPLSKLDLADHTVDFLNFVPTDQDAKLAAIADAAGLLAPALAVGDAPPALTPGALRASIAACLQQLDPALAKLPPGGSLARIASDMRALATASDTTLMAANDALVQFLPAQLGRLRTALGAKKVSASDVPEELRRDYVLPDGRARIQVVPKAAVGNSDVLRRFVAEVRSVAPDAGGPAVAIVSTSNTIIGAFRDAAFGAIVAITIILLLALRKLLDAALVLAPLLLSAAMTVVVVEAAGISLNYANIIALPLLLGVGVSFNIYFVMNWRAGRAPLLTSATTRAVVFSALTTGTAFGSLALSAHPGTASMGTLLLISLGCTLLATLVFVPALLGRITAPGGNVIDR